jgi:hypothetical protein
VPGGGSTPESTADPAALLGRRSPRSSYAYLLSDNAHDKGYITHGCSVPFM